jgi:hypothetical protein
MVDQLVIKKDSNAIFFDNLVNKSAPLNPLPTIKIWSPTQAYLVDDIIIFDNRIYRCLINNTGYLPYTDNSTD